MVTPKGSILPAMHFSSAETKHQAELWDARNKIGLPPHINPGSTLVAAMGNYWHPGSFEAVMAMVEHTWTEGGLFVRFYSEQDRCYDPYDALGTMRNLAYMRAIREGFEYLLYVDNDVIPLPTALLQLQARYVPVIAPILRFTDGETHNMRQAALKQGDGLAVVHSVLLSFVLFRTEVFMPWALTPFWDNARGSDEEYHWERLALAGHHPFVDCDTVIQVANPPHFPFDHIERGYLDLSPKEAIQNWRKRDHAKA